jgi:hypothetical protein
MKKPDKEVRAFYNRQANQFLALARECDDPQTIEQLLKAARYYLDKLHGLPTMWMQTGPYYITHK